MPNKHAVVTCEICNKEIRSDVLIRHMRTHKKPCCMCGQLFTDANDRREHEKVCREIGTCQICQGEMPNHRLKRHMKKKHDKPCRFCNKPFVTAYDRRGHEKTCCRPELPIENESLEFTPTRSALNGLFSEYDLKPDSSPDYSMALQISLQSIGRLLKQLTRKQKAFKYYIEFESVMKKTLTGFEDEFSFWTKTAQFLRDDEVEIAIDRCQEKIEKTIDEFICNGSGWTFVNFTNIRVYVTQYKI